MSEVLSSAGGVFAFFKNILSVPEGPKRSDTTDSASEAEELENAFSGREVFEALVPPPLQGLWRLGAALRGPVASHLVDIAFPCLVSLVAADHNVLSWVPSAERQRVWEGALARAERDGVRVPRDKAGTYDGFLGLLREHDIEFPERIQSLRTALTVLETRDRLMDPDRRGEIGRDRPILVMIGAKTDHNGALEARCYPTLDVVVGGGRFDVVYYEAGSDTTAERILTDVRDLTGRRIHTIMLDAHGSRQSLFMGEGSGSPNNDEIETRDLEENRAFSNLNDILDPNGQIILLGCSNGAPLPQSLDQRIHGMAQEISWFVGWRSVPPDDPRDAAPVYERYNLAEAFSHLAPNRPVYSSEVPTNLWSLDFDPQTLRPVISWRGNQEYVALSGLAEYHALKKRQSEAADRMMAAAAAVAVVPADPVGGVCDPSEASCGG